jgi:hypothetical protein
MIDKRVNYGVQLSSADRAALEDIARRWNVKPSEVVRITIRALAEAAESQGAAVPLGPRPDGAPMVQPAAELAGASSGQGVGHD